MGVWRNGSASDFDCHSLSEGCSFEYCHAHSFSPSYMEIIPGGTENEHSCKLSHNIGIKFRVSTVLPIPDSNPKSAAPPDTFLTGISMT